MTARKAQVACERPAKPGAGPALTAARSGAGYVVAISTSAPCAIRNQSPTYLKPNASVLPLGPLT